MSARCALSGFVGGCALVQTLGQLPSPWVPLAAVAVLVLLGTSMPAAWRARAAWRMALALVCGAALGVAWASLQAQRRLDDELTAGNVNLVSRVVFQVAGLPQGDAYEARFEARVLGSRPAGVPSRIQVNWFAPGAARMAGAQAPGARGAPLPVIVPGQVWQAALVMRRPSGMRNPSAFDYEGWMFQRGVRALGTVRGTPRLQDDPPRASAAVAIQRLRWHLREAMAAALAGTRYGPVLIALALGDQAGVQPSDWEIFNLTGITHLVSISGSHVTLIAAVGGMLAVWSWKRVRWRGTVPARWLPAQVAGACAALLVAAAYCLLAGWGVPARRTFFMLAVVAVAAMMRLPMTPWRVLPAAAALVSALDPWSPLAPGFWLSFGAVAVLMQAGAAAAQAGGGEGGRWRRAWQGLRAATRLQWLITLALTPVLAYLFQQVPLVSPLANAIAIPVVTFVVTPLALLAAALLPIPGLGVPGRWAALLGEQAFAAMMAPIVWLSELDWAFFTVAAAPWPYLAMALAGVFMALREPGWPARWAGWLLALPVLVWTPARPAPGEWRITALDVGQGAGVVIETARHTVLYDTGVRYGPDSDAAQRAILPFLRAQAIRALDVLVVSHADLDHAGGMRSVLQAMPVAALHSSFDVRAYLRREVRMGQAEGEPPPLRAERRDCEAGMAWTVDDVRFAYLHPGPSGTRRGKDRNAESCVLMVEGRHHRALLTGDIPARQEAALVSRGLPTVDWVLAAHHGAGTSSSPAFVDAVQARHVVAQAGHHNRFGHPVPAVVSRWERAGARFWRSDRHGAVVAVSAAHGLAVEAERLARPRYWQGR